MQTKFKRVLAVLFLTFIISALFFGCVGKTENNDIRSNYKLSDYMELSKAYGVNKFSAAITENSKTQFLGTDGEKASDEVYEAGSIGKVVTAYICLSLADEGKLNLDAPITDYLEKPWITDDSRFKKITARMLLSHTAGFSPSFETGIDRKIYFEPGSRFSYSGVGYIYLQNIIEKVSGESFEKAASKYVFEPLSMNSSTFENKNTVTPFCKVSFAATYVLLPWIFVSFVIFSVGFLFGVIFKKRFVKSYKWLLISTAAGFIVEIVLIVLFLPRLILTACVVAIIGGAITFALRNKRKIRMAVLPLYFGLLIAAGFLLNVCIPLGPQLIDKGVNAAYSFKTTAADMETFTNKLSEIYESDENTAIKEMFSVSIQRNDCNFWSEGLGIENCGSEKTYWHSGINPGMQSLIVIDPQKKAACVILTNSDNGLDFSKKVANDVLSLKAKWDIERTKLS